jgi:hypothetical protein
LTVPLTRITTVGFAVSFIVDRDVAVGAPGFASFATCSVTLNSPALSVGATFAVTPATPDSTFVTENAPGAFRLFERIEIVRVAAESVGAISPKLMPVGSTRNGGRTTPATLTQYSGWCLEFVTILTFSASGPTFASGPPTVTSSLY